MEDEKIDLQWQRFSLQLGAGILALATAIIADTRLLTSEHGGETMGAILILMPFVAAAYLSRVPYKTDIFERRLRNWSMTQSATWVLMCAVGANLIFHMALPGEQLVSPYVMPAAFLTCHALYSQYLRRRVAAGKPNRFTG